MESFINNSGLFIILICSLVYCFFGYRFFKFLLSLAGSIIFSSVAWKISMQYFEGNQMYCLPIAIVAAILGGWLFYKLFKFAAFLYGTAAGFALSPVVLALIQPDAQWVKWAVPAVCALGGGLFLLFSHRLVLILMTAASGALYFALSLFLLLVEFNVWEREILDKPDSVQISLWLFCFAITFLSGAVYQFKDKKAEEPT